MGRQENSVKNIFEELTWEYRDDPEPFRAPYHGDLTSWANQGVLLLNATLTGKRCNRGFFAQSTDDREPHKGKWDSFLKVVITSITKAHDNLIFMLWGLDAQKCLEQFGVIGKHTLLSCAHPSGRAKKSRDAFFQCGHFKTANEILIKDGKTPINWHIDQDAS